MIPNQNHTTTRHQPIDQALASVDVCSVLLLALALNTVGGWACAGRVHLQRRGLQCGIAAFAILLLAGLVSDGSTDYATARLMQAGVVAACVSGAFSIVLPFLASLIETMVMRPTESLRFGLRSWRNRRYAKRVERQQQARVAQERAEWERTRPERERAAREAAQRQQAAEQHQQDQQRRRDAARFRARLLYDRHAGDIKESMSRRRFDDYLATYLSDVHPAEQVEERARALQAMILDFFEQTEEALPEQSLDEIRVSFAEERRRIEASDLEEATKAAMLADVNLAEDKALRRRNLS